MSRRSAAVLVAMAVAAPAGASRSPEAIEAEREAQALELRHLVKKTDALSASLVSRRDHLRRRLRVLYKMSQGGYARLLLGADSPGALFARRDAADRVLRRDLDELRAIRDELRELDGLRDRLREGERRADALVLEARERNPTGLARPDGLRRPIGGLILRRFGPYRDPNTGLSFTRDGVDLRSLPGEAVRAPAAGEVRSVGEVPGLGLAIVLDHGDGWVTLLGRLAAPRVEVGARVASGDRLADALGSTVHLQVSQSGVWLDPAFWLGR